MDTIVAALITGFLGLVSGVLVAYRDELKEVFSAAARPVAGLWVGEANDIEVPGQKPYDVSLEYELRCEINQRGRSITGKVFADSDAHEGITLRGKLRGNYLVGEYQNDDPNALDWGAFLLFLSGTGNELTGHYLGMRMREDGVVFGRMTLRRASHQGRKPATPPRPPAPAGT
jgi:hypothetical protein